ncbi:FAD-binding oxidoreductase [Salicibibacter cibarius]|uniref:FAD-binding oxidoreductase n=1 Tax=Salicibibacter cibarius TaxID=2743000 RepID=A0A7T6Z667_9BACI|nr:FAD-dependent oxidoreductase [Salicibibacter cibarius]QQK77728.1 FAD-binding oxidoreductase [Salicibibacter cibarius]
MSNTNTDIAIIGGGIIGAAIAYYLGKAGHTVTVIDRGDVASGTSSKCDGNILAIDKDPGFDSQMSLQSQNLVKELSEELTLPFEYRNPGSILVCESEQEMEAAEKWVQLQKDAGLSFRMLDREDIHQESPYFSDHLPGGLECASDATVNPYLLTYALMEEAMNFGCQLRTHTEVTDIQHLNDGCFNINTTDGAVHTQKVVNAAGVWAREIGAMVGLEIPIYPRKGHILVSSRSQPVGERKMMEFGYLMSKFGGERQVDEETERYGVALVFEPTESQNFLIGSSREFIGFDSAVNHRVVQAIARRAIRFYPGIEDMLMIRAYTGFRPWTEDHLPIVSKVDDIPGFYVAAGHEGDGISLAAVTGKLVSEMINEKKEMIVPPEPLSLQRFQKKVTQ